MIRVGIIGATGYTGARLVEYLRVHPEVEIVFATSESFAGKNLSDVYGRFAGAADLKLVALETVDRNAADVVFSCIPDQTSMKLLPGQSLSLYPYLSLQ